MSINLVIAVTDGDWFETLRRQPNLSEVNFWAPSASNFRALQPGEMFLFKPHSPHNVIVGGSLLVPICCNARWPGKRSEKPMVPARRTRCVPALLATGAWTRAIAAISKSVAAFLPSDFF